MTITPKEAPYGILSVFDILQNIVNNLWLEASWTLLPRTALGKAKRHAMHNAQITVPHLNFDDMETLQHILSYRSNAIINNKNTEKVAGNIFINDKVLQSRMYFVDIFIPFKNDVTERMITAVKSDAAKSEM